MSTKGDGVVASMRGRWLSVALVISGLSALAITVMMNRHAGESMGATAEGRALLSAAAIAVDVIGVCAFGLAAGIFANKKGKIAKTMAVLFAIVMLGSVAFSIQSIMNFIAAERLSVDNARKAKEEEHKRAMQLAEDTTRAREKAALDAAEFQRKEQARLAEQHLKWLQGVARKDDLSRRERKEILTGAGDVIAKLGQSTATAQTPTAIEAPKAQDVVVNSEGGTQMMAEMTGVDSRSWLMVQMAQLAILLILYKGLAFPAAGLAWRRSDGVIDLVPVTDGAKHSSAAAAAPVAVSLAAEPVPAPLAIAGPPQPVPALEAPQTAVAAPAETKPVLPAKTPAPGPAAVASPPRPDPNPFLDRKPVPGSEAELRAMGFPLDGRPSGPQRSKDAPKLSAKRFARVAKAFEQTGGFWADDLQALYHQFCIADHREPTNWRDFSEALKTTPGVDFLKKRISTVNDNKAAHYTIAPGRYSRPKTEPANDTKPSPPEVGSSSRSPFSPSLAVVANDTAPMKVLAPRINAPRAPAFLLVEPWAIAQSRALKAEFRGPSRKQRGARISRMARAA